MLKTIQNKYKSFFETYHLNKVNKSIVDEV